MKKRILSLLVLLVTAVTGAWAQTETLLTTITATGKDSYSETTPGVVTVTHDNDQFSEDFGWKWGAQAGSLTVKAKDGYTITKCVFSQPFDKTVTVSTSPFKVNFVYNDEYNSYICEGTNPDFGVMNGVLSIEVYGYASYSVTMPQDTPDAEKWTARAGTGDYQSLPLEGVAAGTAVNVKYSGTKMVKSVKAVKKAAAPSVPDGAISGVFSVSDTKQVYFSKGNLRYASSKWSFFDNQYDYYTSYSAAAWDHFGWSTSATTYGMNTSTSNATYSGDFVDWGATMGTGWFTLTSDEWTYLFNTRSASTVGGTENGRYAKAKVNDVQGVILFPDTYTHPDGVTAPTGVNAIDNTGWNGNSYTVADWTKMESAGCVFLPAAGYRGQASVQGAGSYGYYWSSSPYTSDAYRAYLVFFYSETLNPASNSNRNVGYSVRLVQATSDAAPATPALSITSPSLGQVIGSDGKNYAYGSLPTGVTAVAKICYVSGSNGLALALTDEESTKDWSTAKTVCAAHTAPFTGGTWKLASKDEWDNMVSAAGSHTALRDGFSSVGGTNMQSGVYWTSTEDDSDFAWYYRFDNGNSSTDFKENDYYVRACLAFTVEQGGAAYTLLSAATAEDVGKVVCAAGHLHDAKTAVPAGCTAVGILGKVTATGHGLILALQNATAQNWNTINGWTSVTTYASTTLKVLPDDAARGTNLTSYTTLGETTVSNWAVAQKSDYEAIFENLGSTKIDGFGFTYDDNVNAYITTGVVGTALTGEYWSAMESDDNWAWFFRSDNWYTDLKTYSYNVRPVLGFGGEATPAATDLSTISADYEAKDGETLTGTLTNNVKISIADGATVTLNNVTINGTNDYNYEWAGITCEGDATIILSGTNTVKGFFEDYPGIQAAAAGKTLTINGTGSLTASSYGGGAGIGGQWKVACGNIEIQGGTITATSGDRGAGIGGGDNASCGNITISGGTVNATGGQYGAGIGGGDNASWGNITISGGTVTATGGERGAGIGGGRKGSTGSVSSGNILISGGTVTATGGARAAGIGGGSGYNSYIFSSCGSITITTGVTKVTATMGSDAPNSIGAGQYCDCGTVTIGGNVGAITTSPYTYQP